MMNANLHCDANKDAGRLYILPQPSIQSEVTRCLGILRGRITIFAVLLRRVSGILQEQHYHHHHHHHHHHHLHNHHCIFIEPRTLVLFSGQINEQ